MQPASQHGPRHSRVSHATLQNGGVEEQGSHQELLQQEGLYSRLWSRQVKATSEEPSRTASSERSKPEPQPEKGQPDQQQPGSQPAQRRAAPQDSDQDEGRGRGHGRGHGFH